jgi:uncharacterized protein YcbK (DUF882 family)
MTEHFNPITDVKLLCTCGHELCDKRSVNQYVLNMLELVRIDYGKPMIVTSGGRCPYHPNEVHRSKPADHQLCLAVDIRITGLPDAMRIMAIAVTYGFNAFGISLKDGFIHLGYRPDDKFATWSY